MGLSITCCPEYLQLFQAQLLGDPDGFYRFSGAFKKSKKNR